ncbi:hypothetical protein GCM10009827_108820 [Dactylosporangium maewongense]|uniref:Uncharacterized protein n=1 Tax=Dactylosporangium maewongense TaxID=634393 RepID=A0ABN2D545_9ACTN
MGSLDDALGVLLAEPATATLVRGLLAGMRAALEEAAPGNAAREAIDRILAGGGAALPAIGRPISTSPGSAAATRTPATPLWTEAAQAAGEHDPGPPPADRAQLWSALHLLGLRMAPDDRRDVQTRAADEARAAGATVEAPIVTIRGIDRDILIPRLSVGGRTLHDGLATDPDAPLPAELRVHAAAVDRAGADPATVAFTRLVVPVLHLLSQDRHLRHCLQSLHVRGLAERTTPTDQDRLRGQLTARTAALIAAVPGDPDRLECLVRLHEAVTSVVHLPPAADVSWWGRLRVRAHTTIRDAAAEIGPGLVKLPPARFDSAQAFTADNIPLRIPEVSGIRSPDVSGMVLACVRVWARVHDTDYPGRVIYAS